MVSNKKEWETRSYALEKFILGMFTPLNLLAFKNSSLALKASTLLKNLSFYETFLLGVN